ncbi:MAG TPA: hypothetical protein VIY30_06970 [Burkholderiaceae bacterium]
MHPWILGVAVAALGGVALAADDDAASAASPPCPRANAAVLERFISAECEACWTAANVPPPGADEWLLDWIVPSARGDNAPLSPAAPAEAAARSRRALGTEPANGRTIVQRSSARAGNGLHLRVASGPAWSGYFAVQLDGAGRAPSGATAWIALVESVNAGTDGTIAPRQLVRTVAGPFEPAELRSGKPWQRLQAMRWPATAKAVRLSARAWIEQRDGRIVAMASERCDAR